MCTKDAIYDYGKELECDICSAPFFLGQCMIFPNSTTVCKCHCDNNCRLGCETCDLGWSGSKMLYCQKGLIQYIA